MARLKFAAVPPKEVIKQTLEQRLPQYKYSFRGGLIVCAKTSFTGAIVVPKKDGVVVNGNFPSMGATFLFVLFMIGTGILIGLLIWLVAFKGGQDKVRVDVEGVLQQAFAQQQAA
ncbi:MAG: hypothetical protein M4D80_18530 [Myxococcota bacterium]|nr:hypothetical protein [Deltaproteobacteria bacterium]MDQ3337163.1 hypothetical protein [Myxococcota bacterium]